MKRVLCAAAALVLLLSLTACGSAPADNSLPGRMVAVIDIDTRPYDEGFSRHYTSKENLAPIIRILRELDTEEPVEQLPDTDLEQDTCTITATYANGDTEVYCILERQFLRRGQEDWHTIDPEKLTELEQFIRDTPSDAEKN